MCGYYGYDHGCRDYVAALTVMVANASASASGYDPPAENKNEHASDWVDYELKNGYGCAKAHQWVTDYGCHENGLHGSENARPINLVSKQCSRFLRKKHT